MAIWSRAFEGKSVQLIIFDRIYAYVIRILFEYMYVVRTYMYAYAHTYAYYQDKESTLYCNVVTHLHDV